MFKDAGPRGLEFEIHDVHLYEREPTKHLQYQHTNLDNERGTASSTHTFVKKRAI